MRVGIISAVLVLLCWTTSARAQQTSDRAFTSGLGIGTGLGSDNVGLGGHVLYYWQLPHPRFRIAFHVGSGVNSADQDHINWGVRGGSFLAYGKRHRLVVGLFGGTTGWRSYYLHGAWVETRQCFGMGLGVGYEWMSQGGFYVRGTVGPAFRILPRAPLLERDVGLRWTGNLIALGYKIW